jgi:hypothetical protein
MSGKKNIKQDSEYTCRVLPQSLLHAMEYYTDQTRPDQTRPDQTRPDYTCHLFEENAALLDVGAGGGGADV